MKKDYPVYNTYHLCMEMLETANLIEHFDKNNLQLSLPAQSFKGIFITGEGSSRLIPGKLIIEKNLQHGAHIPIYTDGATQALEYDLSNMLVIGLSNSGRTKELIRLFDHLKRQGTSYLIGITANENSLLEERADYCYILKCGKEKAVAATKSVVEQTLVMEAIYEKFTGIQMV
ncbi:MAG: SIS domain-containing protein, partial [Saprospiraceae bacterium]|nr:SIS domain-containing protein [Saprospiraceae bacterium]